MELFSIFHGIRVCLLIAWGTCFIGGMTVGTVTWVVIFSTARKNWMCDVTTVFANIDELLNM